MPKKPKCQSCTGRWCRNHVFELTPLSKETFYKKIEKARFCPTFNKNSNQFYKSLPMANKDRKFYTPMFILEDQQNFYHENDQRFLNNHMEKIQDKNSGTSQMLVPNNGKNKKFCSVCRDKFEDYLQHIGSPTHKENIQNNKFNDLIKELENRYKKARENQILVKAKVAFSTPSQQTNQVSLLPQLISLPDLQIQIGEIMAWRD